MGNFQYRGVLCILRNHPHPWFRCGASPAKNIAHFTIPPASGMSPFGCVDKAGNVPQHGVWDGMATTTRPRWTSAQRC
jgi:hypothetical protein